MPHVQTTQQAQKTSKQQAHEKTEEGLYYTTLMHTKRSFQEDWSVPPPLFSLSSLVSQHQEGLLSDHLDSLSIIGLDYTSISSPLICQEHPVTPTPTAPPPLTTTPSSSAVLDGLTEDMLDISYFHVPSLQSPACCTLVIPEPSKPTPSFAATITPRESLPLTLLSTSTPTNTTVSEIPEYPPPLTISDIRNMEVFSATALPDVPIELEVLESTLLLSPNIPLPSTSSSTSAHNSKSITSSNYTTSKASSLLVKNHPCAIQQTLATFFLHELVLPIKNSNTYPKPSISREQIIKDELAWLLPYLRKSVANCKALHKLNNTVFDPNHPMICQLGYGNLIEYFKSTIRIVTTGVNGSSEDIAYKYLQQRANDIFNNCIRKSVPLSEADVEYLFQTANSYFDGPHAKYFTIMRYVTHIVIVSMVLVNLLSVWCYSIFMRDTTLAELCSDAITL